MSLFRRNFDLWPALRRAINDDNAGPELARVLDTLVMEPGEDSAKAARKHLRRLHDEHRSSRSKRPVR